MSVTRIAALYMAKARYKDKKVVKDSDGKDMTVYEYSERQVSKRNTEKADRVQKLRALRSSLVKRVKKDYSAKDLKTRLTALAVGLIDHTYERVGNDESASEGHFGVTGWLVKHVSFSGGKATIKYVGKSGVRQTKTVTDSGAVKLLREAVKGKKPGDPIFTVDDVTVTPKEVNEYLPEGITAKDLRGLHANEEMLDKLKAQRSKGPSLPKGKKDREKILKAEFKRALEDTAKVVGHEPSTLRSQYLVPAMEDSYMKDGTVIDKLNEKQGSAEWMVARQREISDYIRTPQGRARLAACIFREATKTDEEKRDEDAEKKVRKDPKKKPPRYDLRDNARYDPDLNGDPDLKADTNEKDPDMSLNYKRVARLFRAKKSPTPEGAKALHEKHQEKHPDTKLTWQDFYERPEGEGTVKEPEEAVGKGKKKREDDEAKEPKPEKDEAEKPEKAKGPKLPKRKKNESDEDYEARVEQAKAKFVSDQEKAKANEAKERINKAVSDSAAAYDGIFGGGRVQVPREVSRYLPHALENMTPEQVEAFGKATAERAQMLAHEDLKGENAVEKAERTLDLYSDAQIEQIADPARLAEVVSALTYAEHVLAVDKRRQSGAKKALTRAFGDIEKQLRKELGDARYRIPSDVRRAIQDEVASLGPAQIQQFAEGVKEGLKENADKYGDSEGAAERAHGDLEEFHETIEGVTNPDTLANAVAEALRAKRVVERQQQKGKDRKRAGRKVHQALARSMDMLVSEIPRDVKGKVDAAFERMDPVDVQTMAESIQHEAALLIARYKENPEDPHLLAEAVRATEEEEIDTKRNPREIAQQAALLLLAHGKIASPFEIGGTKIDGTAAGTPEKLAQRGLQALAKFDGLPQELRDSAAKQLHKRIKATQKGSPEYVELNRVLDGLALAAWTDPKNESIPKIPGRDVSAQFIEIAKAMRADGKEAELLGPASNLRSSDGIRSMRDSMSRMSDEALTRAMKETQPELAKALEDSIAGGIEHQYLTAEKSEILRDVMRDIAVDEMVFMDAIVQDAMQQAGKGKGKGKKDKGPTNFGDPNARWMFGKKRKSKAKKHSKGFLDLLADLSRKFRGGISGKTADQNSPWGNSNLQPAELKLRLRAENLRGILNFIEDEFGSLPNSPWVLAIQRFLETGNSDFLNSEPAEGEFGQEDEVSGKKSASKFQSSPYTGAQMSAGQRACAGRSIAPSRREPMSEALKQAKLLTSHIDNVADLIQKNAGTFQIPEKIALDFAKRCDLISDHLEKHAKTWTMDPKGNFNVGPAQPFNPAEIGQEDSTPPKTEPDEPYMKKNFVQDYYDELREIQQTGGFSNAKAAAMVNAAFARMAAKIADLEAKVASSELPTGDESAAAE